MTYSETIDFLYSQLPMFSKTGSDAIKKGLDNIIHLCESLGNPQNKFKCIHIAGTNGKGSVSHMTAAILQSAGYKTGLYTSPHLVDFRERIKINGVMISQDYVVNFVERITPQLKEIHPSFFEITVAMAFDLFASQYVDIAVIETGLGGRLDSTNIIHPELSIITNISYDHTDLLGDTLELIASEKAGIIKQSTPVVIGEVLQETRDVFIQKALQENAPVYFAEESWNYCSHQVDYNSLNISILNKDTGVTKEYQLDLKGTYQIHNLITLLESVKQLKKLGWNISDDNFLKGICNTTKITGLKGRWDIFQLNPMMVIDVGHNAHGIKEVLNQIKNTVFNKLHIVTGMVKEKDINSVLQLMPVNANYYFTKAQIPRALNEVMLLEKAKEYNLSGKSFITIESAIKSAMENASKEDLIVICGSVFVAGEAYQYLSTL
jgi:dihydrofolate synthase / folylpolyglutamate synthase